MADASTQQLVKRACRIRTVIPAFNIPYLPMVAPILRGMRSPRGVGNAGEVEGLVLSLDYLFNLAGIS